jgi:O-antigen/teichoic acid export membrane protein
MATSAAPPAQLPADQGFGRVILGGLAWKALSRTLFELTKVGVAVALARLLTPEEYGLAAMVLVLVSFEPTISGNALASALVQRKTLTEEDKSTVFWTNLGIALAFSAGCIALAEPVARFYGSSEVRPLFAAVGLVFVLSALSRTHSALLTREMKFRSLELRSIAGVMAGAVAAIVVAAKGYGPWALVAQQIAAFGVATLLLWMVSPWRPRFIYSRNSIRELRGFGGNVSATLLLFQLNQTTDRILVGRFLGAAALGMYSLATNVILLPFTRLVAPLHDVLYPVFSRVQDDPKRLASIWLRSMTVIAAISAPAMLGLVVVAPELVDVVFGTRWHDATPVVQILAWVGLLIVLQGFNSVVLQAVGQTRLLLRYAVASFVSAGASFAIGLHWGIVGVALCFAVATSVVQPLYMHLTARAIGIGMGDCLSALRGVFEAALGVAAAAAAARQVGLGLGLSTSATLMLAVVAGAAAYAPLCAWRAKDVSNEALRLLRRRRAEPALS